MTTIQIFGAGDAKTRELHNNLSLALAQLSLQEPVEEVSEYNQILAKGIAHTPALVLDGNIISEGSVPSVEQIKDMLKNRNLLRSKLYRLKRILVAIDFSPASENALVFACHMAHLFDANVDVVYVMDSIFEGTKPSPSGFMSSYRKTMQDEVDVFVSRATRSSNIACVQEDGKNPLKPEPGAGVPRLRSQIAFGFPEEVLGKLSEKADLLVMGTTGRGNLTRKLFGSVSIAVSKTSNCPVLLVPPQTQFTSFGNILYASNFESLDPLTVKQTVSFARRFKGQLHFVHVGPAGETGDDLEARLFEINNAYADSSMPFIFNKIVGEDVVGSLHEYAYEHRVGLFVFVTHHRSFWEDLLHHSISKDMLLHTSSPVLVIHADSDMAT